MDKKQLKKWQEIYSVAMRIGEYRPWELISEENALVYFTKDGKQVYLFKIWGNTFDFCGISCYSGFKGYMSPHNLITNSQKNIRIKL